MSEKSCGTCNAFFMSNPTDPYGQCRADPPQSVNLGTIPRVTAQGPVAQADVQYLFPLLTPRHWCRRWEPKDTH